MTGGIGAALWKQCKRGLDALDGTPVPDPTPGTGVVRDKNSGLTSQGD
ncbi:MAG: hypothetical protein JW730_07650 [Anaerolineales bacterium]|nr:hypothetical protein [Anaerolineales bacterium]